MTLREPVTYDNYARRLSEEIPDLAPALEELRGWLPEEWASPYSVLTHVFGPRVVDSEMAAHRVEPPEPHECRAADLVRWVELMAEGDDDDVVNAMLIEVFEGRNQEVALRFPWGPRTREALEQWPPW